MTGASPLGPDTQLLLVRACVICGAAGGFTDEDGCPLDEQAAARHLETSGMVTVLSPEHPRGCPARRLQVQAPF